MRPSRGLTVHVCGSCTTDERLLRAELQSSYLAGIAAEGRRRRGLSIMNSGALRPKMAADEAEADFIEQLFLAVLNDG